MKTPKHSVALAAIFLAVIMSGAAATIKAQATTPSPGKMPRDQEPMKGMQAMSGMMEGPHHVLAMAYHDNLVTFARALKTQVTQSTSVNLEIARPAVTEMRRSFEQMKQHHQAQMTMMGDPSKAQMTGQSKAQMTEMMKKMETHIAALDQHLTALETEVNASSPDPRKVSEHTTEILKQCDGMSAMSGKGKPHQMK